PPGTADHPYERLGLLRGLRDLRQHRVLRRRRDERVMTGSLLWYVSRGTGVVTLVLLTLTLLGGVLVRSGAAPVRLPRFVVWGLHRNVALLSLVFLALHVASVVVDSYVPIDLADAVVPFGSAYRPFWLGLGTVALDLLLAIVATSLLRARIGHRGWRA